MANNCYKVKKEDKINSVSHPINQKITSQSLDNSIDHKDLNNIGINYSTSTSRKYLNARETARKKAEIYNHIIAPSRHNKHDLICDAWENNGQFFMFVENEKQNSREKKHFNIIWLKCK